MWFYDITTRDDFEKVKDTVEEIMLHSGAEIFETDLPYDKKQRPFQETLMKRIFPKDRSLPITKNTSE